MTTRMQDPFQLSLEERIRLAQDLWDSVAADPEFEVHLSPAEAAEIERRIAAYRKNPGAVRPVDEFLDELDRRYE
jgi:putative addiction module component (TIGR02574 family)